MIAQLASSSDFETSITPVRAADVSLFARHADRQQREPRALRMRQSEGRRTNPPARCSRDPLKVSRSLPGTWDTHHE
jgi:hypothetical protein